MEASADVFVSSISQKSGNEITKEASRRFRNDDLEGLRRLLKGMDDVLNKKHPNDEPLDGWGEARIYVQTKVKHLEEEKEEQKPAAVASDRVASITTGLQEDFKYRFDLVCFIGFVQKLFHWFMGEHNIYMAPYFPVIQSSGPGKTRLYVGLWNESQDPNSELDFDCRMILCLNHNTKADANITSKYFDTEHRLGKLVSPTPEGRQEEMDSEQSRIIGFLDKLLSSCNKRKKVVFLFDEAQNWLGDDGYAFRCARWWLQRTRTQATLEHAQVGERVEKEVAAVFASTSSNLANLYSNDSPPSGFSRDSEQEYVNWTKTNHGPIKLYPPFFHISTIGCYRSDIPTNEQLSEFERAAYFGRPLFAYLQKDKKLIANENVKQTKSGLVIANSTLHAILKRMLLNHKDWEASRSSCCSILGTRVQMGITTSFVISSELVSHAYAHLVHFHLDETSDIKKAVARIAFMPDPVCAALAMGMMHEHWKLTNANEGDKIPGRQPQVWSQKAMELFSSGLCLPEKGNPGEIMVALYMLFCGDLLRYRQDKMLRHFSIPLAEWILMLKHPNRKISPMSASTPTASHHNVDQASKSRRKRKSTKADSLGSPGSSASPICMEINFIQFCCNCF